MLANYHTHTIRCNHATGTEREYIEEAIKNGFKILGFSDHVPQPYPEGYNSRMRMGMDEIEDYTSTLEKLRDEYHDDIEILIGYEVEYSRRFFDDLIVELAKFPCDYLILGQHFVPNEIDGFYSGNPTDEEERLKSYVDLVIEAMKTGRFSYIAHPDLLYFEGSDKIYQKHMKRLIQASIDLCIPLEINMLGFEGMRNYPCRKFFSLASMMGAKFIIGCDAHCPQNLRQPESVPGLIDFLKDNNIREEMICDVIRHPQALS